MPSRPEHVVEVLEYRDRPGHVLEHLEAEDGVEPVRQRRVVVWLDRDEPDERLAAAPAAYRRSRLASRPTGPSPSPLRAEGFPDGSVASWARRSASTSGR
jgi:hypothetical protein